MNIVVILSVAQLVTTVIFLYVEDINLLEDYFWMDIFERNCFTLVLRILITIIPAAVLSRQQTIYVAKSGGNPGPTGLRIASVNANVSSLYGR